VTRAHVPRQVADLKQQIRTERERAQDAEEREIRGMEAMGFAEVEPGSDKGKQLAAMVQVESRADNSRGPGGPTGPLGTPSRTLGPSPDGESLLVNAPALVPEPLARL
jgi:hypothetical protein